MSATAAQHTGLPFVPQPAHDELLGSWLLRTAQLYGLGLATLLSRLGVRPSAADRMPHWFALSGASINLDALSKATRLPRAQLAAMAPSTCGARLPEELGACERCLAIAAQAGQPITWNRAWMNPLATTCGIHGIWLTPVATRALADIRHAGDIGSVIQQLAKARRFDDEYAGCANDALWLHRLYTTLTVASPLWGRARPHSLIPIVNAVACEVIAASEADAGLAALATDRLHRLVKDFAIDLDNLGRVGMSLPTQLRQRQWVLAMTAHVLRWPPEERAYFSSWSVASIKQFASMGSWTNGALAWICPPAAELVRQQDMLRREFSVSPRYFKACAALFATLQ